MAEPAAHDDWQCRGYCSHCNTTHSLGRADSEKLAKQLLDDMSAGGGLDYQQPAQQRQKALSLDYLYGPARGQMFGIMEYQDEQGNRGTAKAFSGQYNGRWLVDGWVAPLFDVNEFYRLSRPVEAMIKAVGSLMGHLDPCHPQYLSLRQQRKRLSQKLMRQLHGCYIIHNFRGATRNLPALLPGKQGIATGTGDCCGPKLLNFAARHNFCPLGITEFYLGQANRSGSRLSGHFYRSCSDKCQPILGFMLCGLDSP